MKEEKFNELYFSQGTNLLRSVIKYRDSVTFKHCRDVANVSRKVGKVCGLSSKQMEILYLSALFHDIGNTGIPDSILFKPDSLNPAEYQSIQDHCEIGEEIIHFAEFEGSMDVARIIRHHHEFYDGTGYPDRLSGEDIPLYSRIIGIADSYYAMAENRIESKRKNHSEIMRILDQETGVKHDPYLVKIFSKVIRR